ncbi:MFS transporter, putative metabolite:H+ symporter [Saccharopolyspora antimicrobica]|uniref:MFS transporter n=1 Tax=Saccharopolyspora antimicrobica TaxID=455193 RepID=A0A1I4RZS6_9PSEU|nr:MFS transporter [Saccharopolyspora antimicrobica]RKT89204.1 putative MFS transporter [Saccharopolyspora antimicrobica]SFM57490.1 MFS transporter, putative metabolite:H+ symporter [Saccharopolyspora antimicrobica]
MTSFPSRSGAPNEAPGVSIGDRFERLPFTGYQKKLVWVLALCYLVDAVDLSMQSFLLAPVSQDLGLTGAQAGLVASSVFVGMAVGATAAGAIADRVGRRTVLVTSMFVWGVASLLTAFAWDMESFVVLRLITGIGLGAELPVAFTLLAEFVPAARRARANSELVILGAFGVVASNFIAWGVVSAVGPSLGWRLMFGVMFAVAGLALYVRRSFPESPRWYESRGDHAQADAVMSRFEQQVEAAHGAPLPDPETRVAEKLAPPAEPGLRALFTRGNLRRTAFGWAMWLMVMLPFFGIGTWVGKLLVDRGMSVASSIAAGALMGLAALPSIYLAGRLMDRIGRKLTLAAALVLVTVGALAYGYATGFWVVVAFGAVMQMGLQSIATALNTYTPELFPTEVRATGVGTSQTLGRAAAVVAPISVPLIVGLWGYTGTFVTFAALFALAAVIVLAFGPESRSRSLEELTR